MPGQHVGVMCLHFHPHHPNLLAVGLHDGRVLVLDVRQPSARPLYEATAAGVKHMDAVAAVRWDAGEGSGLRSLAFYSVSADGHIAHWTLATSTLVRQVSHPLDDTFSGHLWLIRCLTLHANASTQHHNQTFTERLGDIHKITKKNCIMVETLDNPGKLSVLTVDGGSQRQDVQMVQTFTVGAGLLWQDDCDALQDPLFC